MFAVPGRVDSRMSQGCHRLIRDGAKLMAVIELTAENGIPYHGIEIQWPIRAATGI